ncbi:MAG: DsrE family protein [Bacteroidales bacterium]
MNNVVMKLLLLVFFAFFSLNLTTAFAQSELSEKDELVVLWTSDDTYLAETVVFMYTHEAKASEWFDEVTLIIWGPSAKLTAENVVIQELLEDMHRDGVQIEACVVCANEYGVNEDLDELGFIELKPMGRHLTDYIKSDVHLITF